MDRRYSDKLIQKCQQVIFNKTGKKISEDTAELYLDRFAILMNAIIKIAEYETKKSKNKHRGKNHKNWRDLPS